MFMRCIADDPQSSSIFFITGESAIFLLMMTPLGYTPGSQLSLSHNCPHNRPEHHTKCCMIYRIHYKDQERMFKSFTREYL